MDTQPKKNGPHFLAFPDDKHIALSLPNEMVPTDAQREGSTGMLVRFRSEEGFMNFLVAAMEAASLVWPEVAAKWAEPLDSRKH